MALHQTPVKCEAFWLQPVKNSSLAPCSPLESFVPLLWLINGGEPPLPWISKPRKLDLFIDAPLEATPVRSPGLLACELAIMPAACLPASSVCLFVCLFVFVCVFVCLFVCLFVCWFVRLLSCLVLRFCFCLFVCLLACLLACLLVCVCQRVLFWHDCCRCLLACCFSCLCCSCMRCVCQLALFS